MNYLKSSEAVEEILRHPCVIVFKHSTCCPVSSAALAAMEKFVGSHRDAPVYVVDVIQDRNISNLIAEKTSLRHESPQAMVAGFLSNES